MRAGAAARRQPPRAHAKATTRGDSPRAMSAAVADAASLRHRLGFALLLLVAAALGGADGKTHNYDDALQKTLLYFEAQRSGRLPSQRVTGRQREAFGARRKRWSRLRIFTELQSMAAEVLPLGDAACVEASAFAGNVDSIASLMAGLLELAFHFVGCKSLAAAVDENKTNIMRVLAAAARTRLLKLKIVSHSFHVTLVAAVAAAKSESDITFELNDEACLRINASSERKLICITTGFGVPFHRCIFDYIVIQVAKLSFIPIGLAGGGRPVYVTVQHGSVGAGQPVSITGQGKLSGFGPSLHPSEPQVIVSASTMLL